ncbi:nad-dependent protein deacetylase srt1, partial [Quercus suber]
YRIQLNVDDGTERAVFILFDKEAEKLLHTTARELSNKYATMNANSTLPNEIEKLIGKTFVFQLKLNNYNWKEGWELYTIEKVFDNISNDETAMKLDHITTEPLQNDEIKEAPEQTSDKNTFEDELPLKELNPAVEQCRMADVVLCLGTSLQITPACDLPFQTLRGGGRVIIVNLQDTLYVFLTYYAATPSPQMFLINFILYLQQTPKDKKASLVIHGRVDMVIAGVMHDLNLQIPPYVRVDLFQINLTYRQFPRFSDKKYVNWTLRVTSEHGKNAPLQFVKSVEVSFLDRPNLRTAILLKQPFLLKRQLISTRPFKISLKINFSDGCGCQSTKVEFPVNFQVLADSINHDKDDVIQKLKKTAIQDQCCGQISLVERKNLLPPTKEISIHAIATDFVAYNTYLASTGLSEDIPKSSGYIMRRLKDNINTEMPLKKLKCC